MAAHITLIDRLRKLWGPKDSGVGIFQLGNQGYGIYTAMSWDFVRIANSVYGNPTGYRCVEAISLNLSRPNWQILPEDTPWPQVGDEGKAIKNHRLLQMLNHPNLSMSGTMMQRSMGRDLELAGKTFWVKTQGGAEPNLSMRGPVTGLRRLPPQRVTVVGNQDDELLGYIYNDRSGRQVPILPDNVVYLRYPHAERIYDGMAPALTAGLAAETDTASARFNRDLIANDGATPGYLMIPGLTPDQFAHWKQEWELGAQPGKTRFIGGQDAKYVRIGQALALNTALPTPDGWTSMADIQEGDTLFDERGQPCRVTFATPIMVDHDCYEVEFSDGTVVTADADHRWLTSTRSERYRPAVTAASRMPKVRTTKELLETLRVPCGEYGLQPNHAIEVAGPLQGVDVELPIEPYTLGAWLGDGFAASARICGVDDEVFASIEADGYRLTPRKTPDINCLSYGVGTTAAAAGSVGLGVRGRTGVKGERRAASLNWKLRHLGLLNNKHIPAIYQRCAVTDRWALLQGLMDTDGTATAEGYCSFANINERLATDVYDLTTGLGLRPLLRRRADGKCWLVSFVTTQPVFRVQRKLQRVLQRLESPSIRHSRWHFIVDIRPVASVPVRCIQVDSPSHLFLCSRSLKATHNTNQELTYDNLRRDSQDDILRGFGVPRAVAFDTADTTYANAEAEKAMFMQQNILPKWILMADELTLQLGAAEGVRITFDTAGIDELQDSRDAVVERSIKLLDRQVMTINEFRTGQGLKPVPWGDEPVAPLQPMSARPIQPIGPDPINPDAGRIPEPTPRTPAPATPNGKPASNGRPK